MKKVLKIAAWGIGISLVAVSAFTLYWYQWREVNLRPYVDAGMEESSGWTALHPSYLEVTTGGYAYSVTFPFLWEFGGNLAVAFPFEEGGHGLIIWPDHNGNYEVGVILVDENQMIHHIYLDESGNAVESGQYEIVEQYRHVVDELLNRANLRWNLQLGKAN